MIKCDLIKKYISEPFLESIPQIIILLIMSVKDYEIIFTNKVTTWSERLPLFVVTFILSVFSATLGIAKFLKVGPCRLISSQGSLGGLGSLGFLTLWVNIASTLLLKGSMLAYSTQYVEDVNLRKEEKFKIGMVYSVPILYGTSFIYVRSSKYYFV